MAGKRGRKAKEAEVVEINDEEHLEELPKKKRGRTNPKSEDKAEPKKKSGLSKVEKVENSVNEDEVKDDEEMEATNVESKENDELEIIEEKESDDDVKPEETIDDENASDVEEKPKRGRGRQKKEISKEKPATQRRGRQKNVPKYTEESDSNEDVENNKAEKSEEKDVVITASKKKGKSAKSSQKNGDTDASPKRSSGRNANKKVASYAEESEDEEVEVKSGKRGRAAGRSKKDNSESDSKKLDKEVRVVLEHCKSWQVYSRNAVALKKAFERAFDDIDVCINPEKPRRGSFECILQKEDGSSVVFWSGIDKGPPRKLKFPDHQEVISRLQKELKL